MIATLIIVVAWVLAALVLTGIGRLISCALPTGALQPAVFPRFWSGFVGASALLAVWQLFFPVNDVARALLLALACAGWWLTRKTWRDSLPGTWAFVIAPLLANRALGPETNADFASYFHETTNWFTTYALPPGLGNLHHRLGFNHSYYLYRAMFETGPLAGRSQHASDGLLFLVSFLVTWPGLVALLRGDQRPLNVVRAILLFPVVHQLLTGHVSSGAADAGVFAFGISLVVLTASLVLSHAPASRSDAALAFLLAAGALTLKLSLVVTALPLVVATMLTVAPADRRSVLRWPAVATLLILVPWMARGVVMSGYPLFPSTAFAFDVPWRVPEGVATTEALYAQAFGRGFFYTPAPGTPWVEHWFTRALLLNHDVLMPACLVGLALVLALARRHVEPKAWLCFIPGLAVWWLGAPEPRHAGALLWGFAAVVFASALGEWRTRWHHAVLVAVLTLALAV